MFRIKATMTWFYRNIFRKNVCVKIDSWTVLNVICVSAAFIQLVFIIANYINPDQLNTIASET